MSTAAPDRQPPPGPRQPRLSVKHIVFGRPLASDRIEHERLNKKTALAVLSSDAISSVAYATEQILLVLAVLGTSALSYVMPISAVIVGLLVLVALSYRQTIFAYPSGGGSYTVARENLGAMPGLVAAAALLTDYILTVAVSVSAGVAAMTSAYPALAPSAVTIGVVATIAIMVVNLRGARESGIAFSGPTYVFIALMLLLIGVGVYRGLVGHEVAPVLPPRVDPVSGRHEIVPVGLAMMFLVLRSFAEGCVAMTGTEAISNGVGAFKSPGAKNAATTLTWMAVILGVFFLGTSYLAQHYQVMPTPTETVLSQLGRHVFGGGPLYYALQYFTFAILVLAANTAFADFPRLASILAQDGYMPRQFAARGDRLAFSNGIVALGVVAIVLIVAFRGDTSALIPLYAIGVFVCFALSQAGMVAKWRTARTPGWRWRAWLNGIGAVATAAVAIIQVATKFTSGAWIVVLIIPAIIWLLRAIHAHYEEFNAQVKFVGHSPIMFMHHTAVVPVNGITKPTAGALVYATTIADDVRAVYVDVDPAATERLRLAWAEWDIGVELVVIPSPYRSVIRPIVDYVDSVTSGDGTDLVTVVVPEVVPNKWWEHLLHNKTALFIRTAFLLRRQVVVTSVPHRLGSAALVAIGLVLAATAADAQLPPRDTSVKVSWGGFVDAYYAWDFGQPASFDRSFAGGALFGTQPARHNEFNVNLAFIEVRLDGERTRGRFAIQTGTSVQANYGGEPAIGSVSGPALARLIQEAYAGARLSDNIWIEGGIFLSHIGTESWTSRDNPTYTRSLVADYSPYYQSGVRITRARGKLVSQLTVVNGWQIIAENNTGKGVGIRLDYAANPRTTVSYFNLFSDEAGNLLRAYHGLGLRHVAGRTTLVAEVDVGSQAGSAGAPNSTWGGATLTIRRQVRESLALAARVERFQDIQQVVAPTGVVGAPLDARGVSIGVDAVPGPRLLWRTELRLVGNGAAVFASANSMANRSNAVAVSSLAATF